MKFYRVYYKNSQDKGKLFELITRTIFNISFYLK